MVLCSERMVEVVGVGIGMVGVVMVRGGGFVLVLGVVVLFMVMWLKLSLVWIGSIGRFLCSRVSGRFCVFCWWLWLVRWFIDRLNKF